MSTDRTNGTDKTNGATLEDFLPPLRATRTRRHRKGKKLALEQQEKEKEPGRELVCERRAYQKAVLGEIDKTGLLGLLWRRQAGKTTMLAEIALRKMLKQAGRLVTFASASLLLGRELIFKEAQVLRRAMRMFAPDPKQFRLEALDQKSGLPAADDFADLFEAQRLEFRVYHSASVYSRTLVIAPNPATARGWTGDVLLDEIGFIADLRELWEAMEPIVSSDPDFRVVLATTPPSDDAHFACELMAADALRSDGSDGLDGSEISEACAEGHWYRSQAGILVHRCDIYDAHAAGAQIYDLENRVPLTPEQHFERALDKDAWRRNYALQFLSGGTSAVSVEALARAQETGQGRCLCCGLDRPGDLDTALNFLRAHLGSGAVGLGLDLATTEKQTSNPSALAVLEQTADRTYARLVLTWKTAEPQQTERIVRAVLDCIARRVPSAGSQPSTLNSQPIARLCIDATNERYFAMLLRQALETLVYVELVVGSERVEVPGEREPLSMKALLGHKLVNALEQGQIALPPERYLKEDFRLVKKSRGSFATELSAQGRHGDTFDACKLALRAVTEGAPGPCAFVV